MRATALLTCCAVIVLAACGGSASSPSAAGTDASNAAVEGAPTAVAPDAGKDRATVTLKLDAATYNFSGGRCNHSDSAATTDFNAMFYPPSGDYMVVAGKDGKVVMVSGVVGGKDFDLSQVQGSIEAGDKGSFKGVDAISGADASGTFACQ